jgi:hypothetical protein
MVLNNQGLKAQLELRKSCDTFKLNKANESFSGSLGRLPPQSRQHSTKIITQKKMVTDFRVLRLKEVNKPFLITFGKSDRLS